MFDEGRRDVEVGMSSSGEGAIGSDQRGARSEEEMEFGEDLFGRYGGFDEELENPIGESDVADASVDLLLVLTVILTALLVQDAAVVSGQGTFQGRKEHDPVKVLEHVRFGLGVERFNFEDVFQAVDITFDLPTLAVDLG